MSCNDAEKGGEVSVVEDSASLKIAVLPTMDCLPLFIAEKYGMYESAGLDVALDVFESAMDADTAYMEGHADVIATDVAKYVHLKNSGHKDSALLTYDIPLYLLSSHNSGLTELDSLDEKVVAVTRNSWVDMAADKIVESVGLKTEDLNRPQINNLNLRASMLVQNQYDCAVLPEPYAAMCESKGARRLCGTQRFGLKMGVLLAHDSVATCNADRIALLTDVYDAAVDTINNLIKRNANLTSYIPCSVSAPDSILQVGEYSHSSALPDSVLRVVEKWVKDRTWLDGK